MNGSVEAPAAIAGKAESLDQFGLPDYLVETYSWAYLRPSSLSLLDNHVVVATILWGNFWRLVRVASKEFEAGQRVLQAASVYGNLSAQLATTVGPEGALEVIDIAPLQVEHCRRKLADYPQASVRLADAAAPGDRRYDGVCCFFLLHEIPDDHKRAVVDALLARVDPGHKVVFVDYHKPSLFHPMRPVMYGVFRWLEPFAFGLIDREIRDFATDSDAFSWRKKVYFGGLYQKVVAERIR
jgi:ubiquinone/menaquinone biosynthesis C-methylase UbiE